MQIPINATINLTALVNTTEIINAIKLQFFGVDYASINISYEGGIYYIFRMDRVSWDDYDWKKLREATEDEVEKWEIIEGLKKYLKE